MQVTSLGLGQLSGGILGGSSLVSVGVGGVDAARVTGARLGVMLLVSLAGTAQVLARTFICHKYVTGNVARSDSYAPPLEYDMKGCLATLTPVGWWTGHNLVPPPDA